MGYESTLLSKCHHRHRYRRHAGAGGPIAAFVAYNAEKSSSDHPEDFGTGIPEGIAAPECANNATVGGALIPMLALGVPGDGCTAIIMSTFAIHGLRLGPNIFVEQADVVHAVYIYTIIANFVMLFMAFLWHGFLLNSWIWIRRCSCP